MATSKKKTVKKTASKPASKVKATTKKAVKKKAVKKTAVKKAKSSRGSKSSRGGKIKVTPEQLHKMICEAAYYISLDRTSATVNPAEDWFQAEAAINKICTVHTN